MIIPSPKAHLVLDAYSRCAPLARTHSDATKAVTFVASLGSLSYNSLDMENNRHVSLLNAIGIAIAVAVLAFAGGSAYGSYRAVASGIAGGDIPANVDFSPVWRAWHVLDERFVPAAVSTSTPIATSTAQAEQDRVWGMISGMADSLHDPYTFFLPPVENKQFSDDMSGQFEGVGMEIAVKSCVLTVVTPLKGTPAEKAGIKSGDHILKI